MSQNVSMEYNKIIAVTGLPGLFELLSSKSDGAIVRSLEDKSTRFVSSRIHNFSHLESIEVYTVRDNVNLVDILKAMEASSEKLPDEKDNAGLKTYFSKVYPDLDFDRVYSSDLKKMVKWYDVLKKNNIEIKLSEPPEEEETDEEEKEELVVIADAPAKAAKKPAVEKTKETKPAKKAKEEAKKEEPKKKTVAKPKKEETTKEKPKATKAKAEKPKDDKYAKSVKKKKP